MTTKYTSDRENFNSKKRTIFVPSNSVSSFKVDETTKASHRGTSGRKLHIGSHKSEKGKW